MNTYLSHPSKPLAVYVHWPFCVSKCPYCDFNSHVVQQIDIEQWTAAYLNELNFSHEQTPKHVVKTIFFGGGTPSLMPPVLMETIINKVQSLWACSEDLEITFEANPTSVESEKFKAFRSAGANRVSIGIQAFNDHDLKFLGRPHNLAEGIAAIEIAHRAFSRVSFDLIYARPHQTLEGWTQELETAIKYAPTHISLYQLTIEPGTAFHTMFNRGDFPLPDEGLSSDLYEATGDILNRHRFQAYEVSNYARPGEECRHNLMYWRYNDYVGIGPGAHGRITLDTIKYAKRRHRAPQLWLDACLSKSHGQHEISPLSSHEELTELMLMGMRLADGVKLDRFIQIAKKTPDNMFGLRWQKLISESLLEERTGWIVATSKGRLKLNGILEYLFR